MPRSAACNRNQTSRCWDKCWPRRMADLLIKTNMYGLLTKCEVKMAGYWPSSFFACLWTETKSRSINSQTWSIKDLLYGFWGNFGYGIQRIVPSGQDRSILPARVANHSFAISFILPARGASHIIRNTLLTNCNC